jgi:CheY-like chemotaxis protein
VLVVEDFEINRSIMAHQLQSNGFQVIEACDGEEAVAKAVQGGIDLILMDIQMPGKDGLTAIREIRDLPTGTRLAIVGFTASADKPTHRRIMEAGADAVLTKPISEAELVTAIQQTLLMQRAQRVSPPPLQSSQAS